MTNGKDIFAQAAEWHLASQGDDMDWDAFTLWLEADPAHARAYDEVALADATLVDNADELAGIEAEPVVEELPAGSSRGGWKRWAGVAIAASLVALVAFPQLRADPARVYNTDSEGMTVTLGDGSTIALAPDSQLTVDGDGEQIALNGGAYFSIRHDPSRSLQVEAGPLSISDIGTEFDVQAVDDNVRVAVAEGKVAITSQRLTGKVELPAGRKLDFDGASGRSTATDVDHGAVGGWRSGQLSYASTPLSLVSADLSRYAGVELEVPAELGNRLFSGTLAIDDGKAAIRDLSQLMGLELDHSAGVYRLREPSR